MTRVLEEPMFNHSRDKQQRQSVQESNSLSHRTWGFEPGSAQFFFTLMTSSIFVQCINGSEVGCTAEVSGNIGRRGWR